VYTTALILVALAGLCYCVAALLRWRQMAQADDQRLAPILLYGGLSLHSVSLILSILSDGHETFAYGVLAVWAAVASILFASKYLAAPSRTILVLPVGGMALLVAMASLAGSKVRVVAPHDMLWITQIHAAFMAMHLAVILLAGSAGGMYLTASRQLKSSSPRALRLPRLPVLEKLTERALVIATALLLGGLATGGAAMQLARTINLAQPSIIFALLTMILLVLALALRAAGQLNRRGMALTAVFSMLIAALGAASQLVGRHG
jgi:hypothetical protein